MKILAEVTYNLRTNTIERHPIHIVTKETKYTYYCKDIGATYKKNKENTPYIYIGELATFKTTIIREEDFNLNNVKQYVIDNLNAELVEAIKTELIKRAEEIKII